MKNHRLISLVFLVVLIALGATSIQSQSLRRLKKELKVWVKIDNAWGLIDGNQQWIIEPNANYADCINMYEDMAILELKNENKDDLKSYQVINFSGDTLLEFKALEAEFFESFSTILFKGDKGYGCLNLTGDTLVLPIYKRVYEDFSDPEKFIVVNEEWNYGLINNQGDIIIPIIYLSLIHI